MGITPACAGKSFFASSISSSIEDHPRMCGEKIKGAFSYVSEWGSPPHVRGKVLTQTITNTIFRITPACAGKRHKPRNLWRLSKDHPRMCGEKLRDSLHEWDLTGSPPHVRGKVIYVVALRRRYRITPACAGKSVFLLRDLPLNQDHPRMCGEKFDSTPFLLQH